MVTDIGVVGAGAWGTALAKVLADKGERVTLWCHGEACYQDITDRRENRVYLTGIALPSNIEATQSLARTVVDKNLIICAVPSHAVREVFTEAADLIAPESLLLCGTKGLEEFKLLTMGELFADILGVARQNRLAFLSGPSFAIEVARGLPTAVTVAAGSETVAKAIQETLSTSSLRVYTSTDVAAYNSVAW